MDLDQKVKISLNEMFEAQKAKKEPVSGTEILRIVEKAGYTKLADQLKKGSAGEGSL
jgi:hypothetical protein